jgi:hypothetical protein
VTPNGVRAALGVKLDTIAGLRCFDYVPDSLAPPAAVVEPLEIDYDEAMNKGLEFYRAYILVIVGRMSDRSSQDRLDAYLTETGASSVKAALEADRTLGGACATLQVASSRPREVVVSGVNMIAYRFEVRIYG